MQQKVAHLTPAFKAKIALAALRRDKNTETLAAQYNIRPSAVTQWKSHLLKHAFEVFHDGCSHPQTKSHGRYEPLKSPYASFYSQPILVEPNELDLMNSLDKLCTEHPNYGTLCLAKKLGISRHKTLQLKKLMNINVKHPRTRSAVDDRQHKTLPYLLRDVKVMYSNHVWSTDIAYVGFKRGFAYLTVIIDWYSRYVLAWRLSNTMETSFCIDALEEAFENFGKPEIFNSGQCSALTNNDFLRCFKGSHTRNSMSARSRWQDDECLERMLWNLKYDYIFFCNYDTLTEMAQGIARYINWYNTDRGQHSLCYQTPEIAYFHNGGVRIVPEG